MTLAEYPQVSITGSSLATSPPQSNKEYLKLYSEMSFDVFPATPGKKKPEIKGWQKKATSDFDRLVEDYSLFGGKFSKSEIGVCTGRTFIIADSDKGQLRGMPLTPTFNTRRGFQYLLKLPEGVEVGNFIGIIEGVDIKGVGGLAILPSESNNREWIHRPDEVEIADCPRWLLEKIFERMTTRTTTKVNHETKNRSYSPSIISEYSRNTTLFDRALYLSYRSFSFGEVLSDLISLNDNYCSPPLPHDEVQSIVDSAFSYVDKEKAERIRAMREKVTSSMWRGTREKNIRSILIAMLTEDIER